MMTERADPENFAKLSPVEQYEQNPYLASEIGKRRWRQLRSAHPIPEKVRRAVLKRAAGRCENCGETARLELHHTTYSVWTPRGPDEWIFGKETPDDLRALCRDCHADAHRVPSGDYEPDPEEALHQREAFGHALDRDD